MFGQGGAVHSKQQYFARPATLQNNNTTKPNNNSKKKGMHEADSQALKESHLEG